ncbi:phosphatase PAP2 family protein [Streptococcus mitis]|uniref:Phosphatase PAP2 family protein n=2 Tax=Streptococcus mitis TaxID=28037 RepID=A0A7X1USP8_STRMT|nr:phosphatase PAP2 family protein [Streptococcus mitis]
MRKYMKNYQEWHDHIAGNIGNKPFLLSLLRTFNRFMTVVMPIIYLTLLATIYLQQGLGKQVGIYLFIPASGFVILSFLRKKINTPRPYEKWGIKPLLDRDSPGQSMPSRHVFSATIISMACLHASLTMGMICLTLSAFLGLVRVLGGVHYPKDVVVGYICGLVWGVIFFLF